MKLKHLLIFAASLFALHGCDVVRQVGSAYNFVNCEYDYNSVSNLTFAGIDLSKGVSLNQAPRILALLNGSSQSIPMEFTVNVDVTNPNQTAAMMSGMQYALNIDNIQFTTGKLDRAVNIPSGAKQIVPVRVGVDLKTLLTGDTADATKRIVKNFIGIGDEKSNVTLQLRPSFTVAGREVQSPAAIPVSFSFGGKK